MMFHWTPDMIRFMKDASEYGSYNQQLVDRMRPRLTPNTHICDAGCGLGYLSLALAPHVGQVTAADANPDALAVLENNCRSREISNIEIRCGNLFEMEPNVSFDSMVFCFFGDIDEILSLAKKHCKGPVFVIQRNYSFHRFSAGKYAAGHSFKEAQERLNRLNIPFEMQELELEFGQPFHSLADARRFFEIYSRDNDPALITDRFLADKLTSTGREDFPLYMNHVRPIGWLCFNAQDIPAAM